MTQTYTRKVKAKPVQSYLTDHNSDVTNDKIYEPMKGTLQDSNVMINNQPTNQLDSSKLSHNFRPLSPIESNHIKQNIYIPIDRKLIPSCNLYKVTGIKFEAISVDSDVLSSSQYGRKFNNASKTKEILYQFEDDIYYDSQGHEYYITQPKERTEKYDYRRNSINQRSQDILPTYYKEYGSQERLPQTREKQLAESKYEVNYNQIHISKKDNLQKPPQNSQQNQFSYRKPHIQINNRPISTGGRPLSYKKPISEDVNYYLPQAEHAKYKPFESIPQTSPRPYQQLIEKPQPTSTPFSVFSPHFQPQVQPQPYQPSIIRPAEAPRRPTSQVGRSTHFSPQPQTQPKKISFTTSQGQVYSPSYQNVPQQLKEPFPRQNYPVQQSDYYKLVNKNQPQQSYKKYQPNLLEAPQKFNLSEAQGLPSSTRKTYKSVDNQPRQASKKPHLIQEQSQSESPKEYQFKSGEVRSPKEKRKYQYNLFSIIDQATNTKCKSGCCASNQIIATLPNKDIQW